MTVGALLGFCESQLTVNEREVLRVLVDELGATLTETKPQRTTESPAAQPCPSCKHHGLQWQWKPDQAPTHERLRCHYCGSDTGWVAYDAGRRLTLAPIDCVEAKPWRAPADQLTIEEAA